MGVTQLFAAGRRLIFKSEQNLPDHKKRMTVSADVTTYRTPKGTVLEVLFIRVFCTPVWKYRIVAIDIATAQQLASTVEETWDPARDRLERELRDQRLIA